MSSEPIPVEFITAAQVPIGVLEAAIKGAPGEPGPGTTTEEVQDAAAALLTAGTHSGITFTYDDAGNRINATVTNSGVSLGLAAGLAIALG
jgi:YD repeat-containing protein